MTPFIKRILYMQALWVYQILLTGKVKRWESGNILFFVCFVQSAPGWVKKFQLWAASGGREWINWLVPLAVCKNIWDNFIFTFMTVIKDRHFTTKEHSKQKWDDCLSSWIVLELLSVVPVLGLSPENHLVGPSQGKETHRETLSRDRERDPSTNLIGVVRAGDQALHLR